MKTRSNEKKSNRHRSMLEEVKCASTSLDVSCGWAVDLSEEMSYFQSSFLRVQEMLKELSGRLRDQKLEKEVRRKIRGVLLQVRKYSRQMADDRDPVTIDGFLWDAQTMFEIEEELRKLLA
jgi:hypothetical protein